MKPETCLGGGTEGDEEADGEEQVCRGERI